MLTVILTLKTVITYIFYFSFKIGQFIVKGLNAVFTTGFLVLNKLCLLLAVIFEDFNIFLQDVIQRIGCIMGIISYMGECLVTATWTVIEKIHNIQELTTWIVFQLYTFVTNGTNSVITTIANIFIFIKKLIILFGEGVWFSITFIPNVILYSCPLILNYIHHLLKQFQNYTVDKACAFYDALSNCFKFVIDVPREAVCGIMIATCFIYIFMQFYLILYIYFSNKVHSCISYLRRCCIRVKQIVERRISRINRQSLRFGANSHSNVSVPAPQVQASPTSHNDKIDDDRFCVICQDRVRCILILPCKHLCLCKECTTRAFYYNDSCPICRVRIRRTMKVYT